MTDKTDTPTHVGLILDGNRRWAKQKNLPTLHGHKQGYKTLKSIAKYALNKTDIKYLSAFIFSTENWNRTKEEVSYLLDLALWVATHEVNEMHKEGVRLRFLGSKERLSDKLLKAIDDAEDLTKNNTKGTLALCFNYGGREELLEAVRKLVAQGTAPLDITQDDLAGAMYAPEIPQIDLLIRTSGEKRTSGYMLYRAAYAELYFTEKYWPDFTTEDIDDALGEYSKRQRRFGK